MIDDPLSLIAACIWLMAAGMYPIGFLFGACSACCDQCSECNYYNHTGSDASQIEITAGSFTLTHPAFSSSVSAALRPDDWVSADISSSRVLFSPDSDIKEYFMDGCLANAVQEYIDNGSTRAQFKLDLDIGVSRFDAYPFIRNGGVTSSAESCSIYNDSAQIVVALRLVDDLLLGIILQNTPLGVCPNADTVTVTLDTKDDVLIEDFLSSALNACEQQLLDFCQALTLSGSFTHTGCYCGPCCSYAEEDGQLIDCEENIAEGACQDFDFKYWPDAENCEEAECPDYREF